MMSKQVLMYSQWCRCLGCDNAALGIWFPTFKDIPEERLHYPGRFTKNSTYSMTCII